jgi:hypothetical protein
MIMKFVNSIDRGGRGLFQDISEFASEIKKTITELKPDLHSKRKPGSRTYFFWWPDNIRKTSTCNLWFDSSFFCMTCMTAQKLFFVFFKLELMKDTFESPSVILTKSNIKSKTLSLWSSKNPKNI